MSAKVGVVCAEVARSQVEDCCFAEVSASPQLSSVKRVKEAGAASFWPHAIDVHYAELMRASIAVWSAVTAAIRSPQTVEDRDGVLQREADDGNNRLIE